MEQIDNIKQVIHAYKASSYMVDVYWHNRDSCIFTSVSPITLIRNREWTGKITLVGNKQLEFLNKNLGISGEVKLKYDAEVKLLFTTNGRTVFIITQDNTLVKDGVARSVSTNEIAYITQMIDTLRAACNFQNKWQPRCNAPEITLSGFGK